MKPVKIYCERGAWRRELAELERCGRIEVMAFPYEGKNRRIPRTAVPSKITCNETNVTCDSEILISDTVESEKYAEIVSLIGRPNELDARHIDSAYKSRCVAFLTPDKGDIIRHRDALQHLLGMRFFHMLDDWAGFSAFVGSQEL